MSEFTDAELCAIAGGVADKKLRAAKQGLSEGQAEEVDFGVHVSGVVSKGFGKADQFRLTSLPVVAAVLKRFGVGPKRLKRALQAITDECLVKNATNPTHGLKDQNSKLQSVFAEVAEEVTEKVDPENRPRRSGSVSSTVELTRVQ